MRHAGHSVTETGNSVRLNQLMPAALAIHGLRPHLTYLCLVILSGDSIRPVIDYYCAH